MSSLLYQKYRPQTFKEIVGNFKTVKELSFRAKEKTIPQTILLSGSSGTGKTTLQRVISKSLTCENLSEDGDPCNQCKYCKDINTESFTIACYEYNGAEMSKQQVMDIQDKAEALSLSGTCKIFFIDEFQGLFVNTDKALDTLLKIIEKPYKNVYFILGTMDLGAIQNHSKGKAVLNRCVLYKLQDLSIQEIGVHLNYICKKESIKVDSQKANILMDIAEYSSGSLRTAISLLERCIFSNIWTREEMISDLGIVSNEVVADLLLKIFRKDYSIFNSSSFNKELILSIRSYLLNVYKTKKGIILSFNAVKIRDDFLQFDDKTIERSLEVFNQMKSLYYIDYITFESMILKLMEEIQPSVNVESSTVVQTKRRRLLENT